MSEVPPAPHQPLVLVVPEMEQDQLDRARAARFIGSVAVAHEVSIETGQPRSLMSAIHGAAEGNLTDMHLVQANAQADVVERTIKAGHVTEVALEEDDEGNILQYGQTTEAISENTLRYASAMPQMRRRSEAETRNVFRTKTVRQQGLFEDYNFVVFSRVADDMTEREKTDAGFFTDTMSCAIQVTSANSEGLAMESAFVAGVKESGAEQHDAETIVKLGALLGVDFTGKSAVEIIDTPLLVHKSLMPNGVVDLVKLYDEAAGGTFFGQAKPQQDYVEYLQTCRQREAGFAPKVGAIVKDLLNEAGRIKDPATAIRRLHKLSEKHMVEYAVEDESIDPRVFGPAAVHIEQARLHSALGNTELAQAALSRAQQTARSSSCPSGLQKSLEQSNAAGEKGEAGLEDSREKANVPNRIRCIKCAAVSPKEKVVTAKSWRCPHCKYEIDICTGEVKHESKPPERKQKGDRARRLAQIITFGEKHQAEATPKPSAAPAAA